MTTDPSDGQMWGSAPARLRERLASGGTLALVGAYDVFSASLVAREFDGVFCSGYGFAASQYGLPDVGHMTWADVVSWVSRIRAILPATHILADVDDGFGGPDVAADVGRRLEQAGASAIMMEDQKRPKRCGHLDGKQVVPVEEYLERLDRVLATRTDLFVLARTDATSLDEGISRAVAFAAAGADAVMVEGIRQVEDIRSLRGFLPAEVRLAVNLIFGGKTPPMALSELADLGVDLVIYSTPCLFTVQSAMQAMLRKLSDADGLLDTGVPSVTLEENDEVLRGNAESRFLR